MFPRCKPRVVFDNVTRRLYQVLQKVIRDRKCPSGDAYQWSAIEEGTKELCIEGSTHEYHLQLPPSIEELSEGYQQQIDLPLSFVNFIDNDMRHPSKIRIFDQFTKNYSGRAKQEARLFGTTSF
jgi:hypothetical protein